MEVRLKKDIVIPAGTVLGTGETTTISMLTANTLSSGVDYDGYIYLFDSKYVKDRPEMFEVVPQDSLKSEVDEFLDAS